MKYSKFFRTFTISMIKSLPKLAKIEFSGIILKSLIFEYNFHPEIDFKGR